MTAANAQFLWPALLAFALFTLSGLALLLTAYLKTGERNRRLQSRLGQMLPSSAAQQRGSLPVRENSFFYKREEKFAKGRDWLKGKSAYLAAGLATGFALFYLVTRQFPLLTVSIVLAILVAAAASFMTVVYRRRRKRARFVEQLPEAIDIIIRGARVGMSLQENFQVIAREMPDPIGRQFRILAEKLGIGIDLETALQSVLMEIKVKELQFMATTLILQRRTGGHYAEVLENLNAVLRDRRAQYLKARALTSEARVSARIVTGITGLLLLILGLTNEAQFDFLLFDPSGQKLLVYCAVSIIAGFFIISRLLRTLQ